MWESIEKVFLVFSGNFSFGVLRKTMYVSLAVASSNVFSHTETIQNDFTPNVYLLGKIWAWESILKNFENQSQFWLNSTQKSVFICNKKCLLQFL